MGKRRADRRLAIHRETLRRLSDRALAEVAGGSFVVVYFDLENQDGLDSPLPRSNAWSGSEVDGNCANG